MYLGKWVQNILYKKGNIVNYNLHYYVCIKDHKLTEFDTTKWIQIDKDILNPTLFSEDTEFEADVEDTEEDTEDTTEETALKKLFGSNMPFLNIISLTAPTTVSPTKSTKTVNEKLKRKLDDELERLETFKKNKNEEYETSGLPITDYKNRILLLDVKLSTKLFLLERYEAIKKMSHSDYAKGIVWLQTVLNIPFGKYKQSRHEELGVEEYFKHVKQILDKSIYGLENVKQDLLEFLARRISNPNGKGYVLALHGGKGMGKTKICKSLAEAMNLPFHQINFGGLNDASVLNGHSETYVGSKPGKLVEILSEAGCMNGIIMLDEVDKISKTKDTEINGILTHLLDEEQNNAFQDNYIGNVPIDLSKILFILTFNNLEKIDDIVSDRMKIIHINVPTLADKLIIAKTKLIPEICETINFDKKWNFELSDKLITDIINLYTDMELGVRKLKKILETIFNKINYYILLNKDHKYLDKKDTNIIITDKFISECIFTKQMEQNMMYI